MKILVTGGGCEEPVDGVRFISNFSTGKTAAAIADFFSENGHQVFHLAGIRAEKSRSSRILTFRTCLDLKNLLEKTLPGGGFDAVIHAAAVSDYSPESVTVDGVTYPVSSAGKIPSEKTLSIVMRRNPKLIELIKPLCKKCVLVGFKLTDGCSGQEKFDAVKKLFFKTDGKISDSSPDFVVLNDKSEMHGDVHPCAVFDRSMKKRFSCTSLQELSQGLLELITEAKDKNAGQEAGVSTADFYGEVKNDFDS